MNEQRILANDVGKHLNSRICLEGWVHRIRDFGKIQFVLLRDRSGVVQLVYNDSSQTFAQESVIRVWGTVVSNERSPSGIEIHVDNTEILGVSYEPVPVNPAQSAESYSLELLLDQRISSLRHPMVRSIFELESVIIDAFGSFLRSNGFTEIKTSKLIGTGTEGGTGLFSVSYFDEVVYLAQSPQFYKQAMVASGLERVFEIGPAYRAEKHETSRHLNEYISLDVEMAFIQDEHDLMDLETQLLQHIISTVAERCAPALDMWNVTVPDSEALSKIPRCTYAEAKKLLKKRTKKVVFDIDPEAERELCLWAQEEHNVPAVFVYEFPIRKRPFYTYPKEKYSRSFDLLYGGVEITTGGQRIHDTTMLKESISVNGLSESSLRDYVKIFSYGCPPHGGFAIGLERLAQKILRLKNVKEASAFPRDRKRTRP